MSKSVGSASDEADSSFLLGLPPVVLADLLDFLSLPALIAVWKTSREAQAKLRNLPVSRKSLPPSFILNMAVNKGKNADFVLRRKKLSALEFFARELPRVKVDAAFLMDAVLATPSPSHLKLATWVRGLVRISIPITKWNQSFLWRSLCQLIRTVGSLDFIDIVGRKVPWSSETNLTMRVVSSRDFLSSHGALPPPGCGFGNSTVVLGENYGFSGKTTNFMRPISLIRTLILGIENEVQIREFCKCLSRSGGWIRTIEDRHDYISEPKNVNAYIAEKTNWLDEIKDGVVDEEKGLMIKGWTDVRKLKWIRLRAMGQDMHRMGFLNSICVTGTLLGGSSELVRWGQSSAFERVEVFDSPYPGFPYETIRVLFLRSPQPPGSMRWYRDQTNALFLTPSVNAQHLIARDFHIMDRLKALEFVSLKWTAHQEHSSFPMDFLKALGSLPDRPAIKEIRFRRLSLRHKDLDLPTIATSRRTRVTNFAGLNASKMTAAQRLLHQECAHLWSVFPELTVCHNGWLSTEWCPKPPMRYQPRHCGCLTCLDDCYSNYCKWAKGSESDTWTILEGGDSSSDSDPPSSSLPDLSSLLSSQSFQVGDIVPLESLSSSSTEF